MNEMRFALTYILPIVSLSFHHINSNVARLDGPTAFEVGGNQEIPETFEKVRVAGMRCPGIINKDGEPCGGA